MAWIRLDDQFADHPKFLEIRGDLEDAATALWVRALGYCNKHETDGLIVRGALRQLSRAKKPEAVAAELVRVGLWETTERGWLVHDYHVYQPRSGRAQATKEQLSAAGKKAAAARWGKRVEPPGSACDPHADRIAIASGGDATSMPPIPIPIPDHVDGGVAGAREPSLSEIGAGAAPVDPQEQAISMAYYLAQRGDAWAQALCDRVASGKSLTKPMRDKLPEAYRRAREGEAAAAKLAEVKAAAMPLPSTVPGDADLQDWAARRWTEARQKRHLPAQEPDPRLIAEVCALATKAAEAAPADRDGWRPTPQQVVRFWCKRYLAERQDKAGGVEDRGYPLAWLPSRCREYPTPKRGDVQGAERTPPASPGPGEGRPGPPEAQDGASEPPAGQRPPAPTQAPREPEEPPALPPPEILASFATIGTGGSGALVPRPSFGRPN
ncbi:hypothetical protein [Sorangium sp. So ce233]|uniref:hypothetical protein n=1 Tax=Sorangium sp. So ce233 TaxID=3133290 RepID=UPI003F60EFE5